MSTKKERSATKARSFSLVEALLALALFALFVTVLAEAVIYGEQATVSSGERGRATLLAEEGLEAARNLRDTSYENLADGTFGLQTTGGSWGLAGQNDTTDSRFTRQLTVSSLDASTKNVTCQVSWPQTLQRTGSVALETRLTNWLMPTEDDWDEPGTGDVIDIPDIVSGLKVQTQGNYAYLVTSDTDADFIVVDITDTDALQIVGRLDLQGTATNLAISPNYAYVTSKNDSRELQIINITNPAAPQYVTAFNASGSANGKSVHILGNYAYLTRDFGLFSPELYVLNITNPASPQAVGTYNTITSLSELIILGNYAYISGGFIADVFNIITVLHVINVSNPASPQGVYDYAVWDAWGGANTVTGSGNLVIVGQLSPGNRMFVFDVTNPNSPQKIASFSDVGGQVNDSTFGSTNQYVYLATEASDREFQVIDVSNPANPQRISQLDLPAALNGISYNGNKNKIFAVGNWPEGEFLVIEPQ